MHPQSYALAGLCLVLRLSAERLQEFGNNTTPTENADVAKAQVAWTASLASCAKGNQCSRQGDVGLHVLQRRMVRTQDESTEEADDEAEKSASIDVEQRALRTSTGLSREESANKNSPTKDEQVGQHPCENKSTGPEDVAKVQRSPVVAVERSQKELEAPIPCGRFINAHDLHPQAQCPPPCPYFAERVADESKPCVFSCRKASQCGKPGTDPLARVPDKAHGYCRRCSVLGCAQCGDVASDTCAKCAPGYWLQHGQCKSQGLVLWIVVLTFASILIMFILMWVFDLFLCRRAVNQRGVQQGQDFRARCILTRTDDAPYPLTTNLLQSPVAGRGTTLMFNFQLFLILWSGIMLSGWSLFAVCAGGHDLFKLGFMQADTPLEYCTVVHEGFKKQHALMWIKWSFCLVAYILSFAGAIVYAVVQERRFKLWDADSTTMMDFAALCTGLPHDVGATKVEDEVAGAIYAQCGERVVGVSVCWDQSSQCLDIDSEDEALGDEGGSFESSAVQGEGGAAHSSVDSDQKPGPIHRIMDSVDSLVAPVFGVPSEVPHASRGTPKCNIKENLEAFRSTGNAFVVFETEAGRNRATQLLTEAGGLEFKGSCMQLEDCDYEPDTVLWENTHVQQSTLPWRITIGVVVLLSLVLFWVVLFFLPATLYLASFIDAHDGKPSQLYSILFSLLVVTGNQIMYNASDMIASKIGFHNEDDRQVAYVMMYTMACIIQVVLDLLFTFKTSYKEMVARGIRTDDGTLIGQLLNHDDIFQAYGMQRAIGQQLYSYVWPATFLLPFLIEPLGTILLPYALQRSLVRGKAWIVGRAAEKSMAHFMVMDLSRYGDVLLNAALVALFAFVPPGLWSSVLAFLFLSHLYIYALDHWRVLRFMPAFCFSGNRMHNAAQYMFAFPVAVLLAAAVFKSNCATLANGTTLPCAHGPKLLGRCLVAGVCHVLFHVAMLRHVVPMLGRLNTDGKDPSPLSYQEAVQTLPKTWFSMNKLHCLRSKYVYQHLEPCRYYCLGDCRPVVATQK